MIKDIFDLLIKLEEYKSSNSVDLYEIYEGYSGTSIEKFVNSIGGQVVDTTNRQDYDSYGSSDFYYERIVHFPESDLYIKFAWTYQSYGGGDYFEPVEVRPKTLKITNYENV